MLEVFVVSDLSARPYLKVAGQTRKIQSSSKLRQVRKGKAEIQDTLLGLTGIGMLDDPLSVSLFLSPCLALSPSRSLALKSDGPATARARSANSGSGSGEAREA